MASYARYKFHAGTIVRGGLISIKDGNGIETTHLVERVDMKLGNLETADGIELQYDHNRNTFVLKEGDDTTTVKVSYVMAGPK